MKYLLPIILFFACNSKQQQGQIKDECLSQSTLYLYSALNDDYIPLFNEWKIQLDSTDYYFTEDVKEVINTIKPLIDTLINQSGGIHPTDFILVNPCRQGGEVVTRIFNHEFNEKLKDFHAKGDSVVRFYLPNKYKF